MARWAPSPTNIGLWKDFSETPLRVVEDAEEGVARVSISSRFDTVSGIVASNGNATGGNTVVLLVPSEAAKQWFRVAYSAVQTAADGSFTASVAPVRVSGPRTAATVCHP